MIKLPLEMTKCKNCDNIFHKSMLYIEVSENDKVQLIKYKCPYCESQIYLEFEQINIPTSSI